MKHKLGVCIPYRNRKEHLDILIPKLSKHLESKGIEHSFYIAHQVDDKLFNRGAMKNIAAKYAFEDGCDYIAWHDVDMIPFEECDYSYPEENPIHIATQLSKYDYGMSYPEYFGGVVLFTKEQVEKTNGYSNDYWDWGMEDDDLFWRCKLEGYCKTDYLDTGLANQIYAKFNGWKSAVVIEHTQKIRRLTTTNHTISVLVRAEQNPTQHPIYLIGDKDKKYFEYPIFNIPGYDYGISFNNSRAISFQFWTDKTKHNYMWAKRYEGVWSWITITVNDDDKIVRFYLNGQEIDERNGNGSKSPMEYIGRLRTYPSKHFYLGASPNSNPEEPSKFFKGDIAKFHFWDRTLTEDEVKNLHERLPKDGLKVNLNFNNFKDDVGDIHTFDIEWWREDIEIPTNVLPHRRVGRFECLPHNDEGLVNGEWVKGETTARNERKYITEMQQGKTNYKEDGINTVQYELIDIEKINYNSIFINVKL
jgi:hypothetical protein